MIDPDRLDPDEREIWDEMFRDGIAVGASPQDTPFFRLWSFAYWCQLELGRVPEAAQEVFDARPGAGGEDRRGVAPAAEPGRLLSAVFARRCAAACQTHIAAAGWTGRWRRLRSSPSTR